MTFFYYRRLWPPQAENAMLHRRKEQTTKKQLGRDASMFNTQTLTQDPLIAGLASGKSVRITPAAKPVYDELYRLAQ